MTHEILRLNLCEHQLVGIGVGYCRNIGSIWFHAQPHRDEVTVRWSSAPKRPPKASEVSCLIRQLGRTVNMSVTFLRLFVSIQFPTPLTNSLGHWMQYATDCSLYTTAAGLLTIDI
jgi:hypothetical protein